MSKEQHSLFKHKSSEPSNSMKKPKPSSWTCFYCFACTNDERVPTKTSMRGNAEASWAWREESIQIPDVDCTTE